VSETIIEEELLELPSEFRSLPYRIKAEAFDAARAMLPPSVSSLGEADRETAWAMAAAHWLKSVDANSTTHLDDLPERPRPKLGTVPASQWRTTSYGSIVAGILDRLPRRSGRGRRVPLG
jgi:hypothetical protein